MATKDHFFTIKCNQEDNLFTLPFFFYTLEKYKKEKSDTANTFTFSENDLQNTASTRVAASCEFRCKWLWNIVFVQAIIIVFSLGGFLLIFLNLT